MTRGAGVRGVREVREVLRVLAVLIVLAVLSGTASAGERYALVVTGANGEDLYAPQYAQWRQAASVAFMIMFMP